MKMIFKTVLPYLPRPRRARRAFSLVEMAIVLGVAGILMGGVWAAAQKVWDNYDYYKAAQEIGRVTQNIREYYLSSAGFSYTSFNGAAMTNGPITCGDITAFIDQQTLIPPEMRRYCPTCADGLSYYGVSGWPYKIDNPYNNKEIYYGYVIAAGSFRVIGSSCASGPATHFRILLMDLPPSACVRLLMSAVNYNDPTMGVVAMCAAPEPGGLNPSGSRPCYSGDSTGYTIMPSAGVWTSGGSPLTPAVVQALCASSATSEVGWEFKLRN